MHRISWPIGKGFKYGYDDCVYLVNMDVVKCVSILNEEVYIDKDGWPVPGRCTEELCPGKIGDTEEIDRL